MVLDAANALAEPLRALHPQVAPLVAVPGRGRGGVRIALLETYADEMQWLADRVVEVIAAGTTPADVAVLCRASADFPAVKNALADRGVAVEVVGLDGMLTAPEVVEVLAVLQVLADSGANPAMLRLLTGPRWRIGPRDLALLGARAAELAGGRGRLAPGATLVERLDEAVAGVDAAEVTSLHDALEDPGESSYDPQALQRFSALAAELRLLRRSVGDPLPDLVHRVVTTIGLDVELASSPEILRLHRAEGLAAFVDLVAAFADPDGDRSLPAFLSWLATAQRYDAVPELDRPATPGAVQLMTVHRAKGLEWPVVVLPSLVTSVFPSGRGLPRWTQRADRLPYPLRGDRDSLPRMGEWSSAGLDAFAVDCKRHDEREERRLGYVALTRAERLVLASGSWWGPTQVKPRGPSDYLVLLHDQCVGGGGTVDTWAPAPPDDAENPVLGHEVSAAWPVVPGAGALARRRAAAEEVRAGVAAGLTLATLRAEHGGDLFSPLVGLDPSELAQVEGWDADITLLLEELAAARSATRRVPLPAALSASELVRLAADEEAFARGLARPLPAAPVASARRGTRFHAWVESHYGARPLLDPDDLPGAADEGIDDDADLAAMQQAFLAGPSATRTPVGVEVPFTLVLAGRVVPGRIDAVFAREDGGYEVVDWKTSARQSADPLQLAIYRVAWAELADVPLDRVSASFVYVRTGEVVTPTDLPGKDALAALIAP
jgi:DNA helicase-2/ATP-dependent DNA helicase PcrA